MNWFRQYEAEQRRQQRIVHLIGIGDYPAKPAQDIVVGDVLVYNYGSTATVTAAVRKGDWIALTVRARDGKEYHRRRNATTLVACQGLYTPST